VKCLCLLAALLGLNVLGIKCDRAPKPPPWQNEWTQAQAGKIAEAMSYLDRMGRRQCVRYWPCRREQERCPLTWTQEVRDVQAAGRFHTRELWQPDGKGLDAAYAPATDEILVEPMAVEKYTAYQLGMVLLDEAIHRGVPGSDTEREHRVYYDEELPRYKQANG